MFSKSKLVLVAFALVLTCASFGALGPSLLVRPGARPSPACGAANAQVPQGFGQGQVLDNMKAASASMKAFYKEHGNMPSSQADFDSLLKGLYSEELSGSRIQASTDGAYRVLGDYRITLDRTVANMDPEIWRKNPPERFNGMPANTVIILSDGEKTYAIWGAAFSGNPILDSNNRALIIYKKMEDEPAK